jgi:hypothetical protein
MLNLTETPETAADQFEAMMFELATLDENDRARRQVTGDRAAARFLSQLTETEQDEEIRRASGYYDESDRLAFERMH